MTHYAAMRRQGGTGLSGAQVPSRARILGVVRKNTTLALILLLSAITIAGVLGVIRLYQMTGG